MPLFHYGTLLEPQVLVRHAGEAGLPRRLRPARLVDYARVALRGTPYPALVVRPGAKARARSAAYRLVPVRVVTARGPVRARAWLAARWRAGRGPA